jgi:hypothetical protein
MRPVGGNGSAGCNKNGVAVRKDLPRHDHTGGNYWFASMTQYQDNNGTLRLGGGLNGIQLLAMDLAQVRSVDHLQQAADLSIVNQDTLKVTNLTGHKLITGYPEGRRMWLNIKWYDSNGVLLREDGEYGTLQTGMDLDGDGQPDPVETILDLNGTNTRIYEAHYAMTKEWADVLLAVGYPASLALAYDRVSGAVTTTLGELAAMPAGSHVDTFHFAINNTVSSDNRIPPYQMSYDEAEKRNALPVPETQYGNPGPGGVYNYWDELDLNVIKPTGAISATIDLLYQGTSWEYIQFLKLANTGANAFLGQEGDNMLAAWLNADVVDSQGNAINGVLQVNGDYKMVPPVLMASIEWGTPPVCVPTPGQETQETSCSDGVDNDCDGFTDSADADCTPACIPTPGEETQETSCDDGLDNDCDGLFDCNDSDCSADPACQTGMACSDYSDKGSCNGDPACVWEGSPKNGSCMDAPVCVVTETPEVSCSDGIDNDCNGQTDCADSNCSTDPACQQVDCSQYQDKTACTAANCSWNNRNKICQ